MGQGDSWFRMGPSDSIFGPTGLVSKTPEISKHKTGSWLELCEVLWVVQKEIKM